jgi:hypothetical protein
MNGEFQVPAAKTAQTQKNLPHTLIRSKDNLANNYKYFRVQIA